MLSKLQEIQNANTRRVIQLVREKGPMSRADLSEKTGIPQPTMTRMIEKLIVGNILKERGLGSSSGGRRPILVTFNENCSYALGVELGRSEVKAALTNLNGKMLSFRKKETDPDFSQKRLITEVHCLIRQTIDDSKVDPALILGVGVGVPGPLNKSENGRISPPNFYGEIDIPLKKMMEERSVYEVTIDNDANCAALAEKWFGDGRDVKNFAYILADVGIGSGLILNHDIYRGTYGEAGEIGHSTIDAFGEQCYCGSYGCLETCASLPVILKRLEKQLKMASEDERGLYLNKTIKFDDLANALRKGSSTAETVLTEAGRFLGVGAANLINLYAPDKVVVGGKTGTLSRLITEQIRQVVKTHVIGSNGKRTEISTSELSEGVVLGAAALVIHRTFYSLAR